MVDRRVHIPTFMTRPGMQMPKAEPPAPVERHPPPDKPLSRIKVQTFAQLTKGEPWLLEQLHVRNHHILLWTTRGQGRVLLHGLRRGFGPHNALFIPAGKLLAFAEPGVLGQETHAESWMRIEVDQQADSAALAEVEAGLRGVLGDVQNAVEDWRPIYEDDLAIIYALR